MATFLGAMLGWMFFGAIHWLLSPVGLIVGAIAGRSFSSGFSQFQRPLSAEQKQAVEQAFFQALFPIMGQIAKADGRICEAEIEATQQLFAKMGLTADARKTAITQFQLGAQEGFDLNRTLDGFTSQANIFSDHKKIFLVYLISIAFADGHLHEAEDRILKTVAQRLGFSAFAYQQLIGMIEAQRHFHSNQQQREERYQRHESASELKLAYDALGVSEHSSDKEIKSAWRKLMSENHPDKLAGRGVPDDMVKLATERSQEIQAAYDLIKKHRKST